LYLPGYVLAVADTLRSREVESLATPMDAVGATCFQRANAYIVDTPLGSGGSAHRGGRKSQFVDHGHHAGFDLATFLRLGGYDESFSHNEDGEYDQRLTASGGRIYLDADIRIRYVPRDSVGALARQYFNYGKGRARNLMKHRERPKLRQLIPPLVLMVCLASLALAPVFPLSLLAPAGYIGLLAVASLVVAVKMRSACGLLAGLASGVMHMAWSAGLLRQMLFGQKPLRVAGMGASGQSRATRTKSKT
jgi:succinoglycan biosynthesis protein ExoA